MATREELMAALRRADAAGDTAAAQAIARRIKATPAAPAKPATRVEAKAAGTPRKERSWGETLTGYARSAARGLADVPDAMAAAGHTLNPLRLAASGADKLLGTNMAEAGWGPAPRALANVAVDKGADVVGAGRNEEGGFGERMVGAGIRGATSAAVPTPFGKAKAIEGVAGALSGMASQGAAEAGLGAGWQTAAGLVGGITPTVAGSALKNTTGAIRAQTVLGGKRAARNRAADTISRNALNKQQAIDALESRPAPIGGTKPTLAETAMDPGIAAMQRAKIDPNVSAQMAQNAQVRAGAAGSSLGPGNPEAIAPVAADIASTGQRAISRAREKLGQVKERVDTGIEAVADFTPAYKSIRRQVKNAYESRWLKRRIPVEIEQPFNSALRTRLTEYYGDGQGLMGEKVSAVLGRLFDNTGDMATKMQTNTRVLNNIDGELGELAGIATAQGARKEASFINGLRDDLEKHTAWQMPDEVIKARTRARSLRAEQGRRFEQGHAGKVFGTKRFGEEKVDMGEIAGKIVKQGAPGGSVVDDITAAIGRAPTEKIAREEFRRLADEGVLTDTKIRNLGEVLKRFPGLQADVKALQARTKEAADFGTSQLGKFTDPNIGPVDHVHGLLEAMDDGKGISNLIGQVKKSGNREALAGLRRTMGEYIKKAGGAVKLDETGNAIPDTNASLQAIDNLVKRGKTALEPQQLRALEAIRKEMAGANYAGHAGHKGVDLPRTHAIPGVTGRVANTIRFLMGGLSNQKQVEDVIVEAIKDPSFALDLLKRKTPDRIKRFAETVGRSTLGAAKGASGAYAGALQDKEQ